jgi:hypothetical protein
MRNLVQQGTNEAFVLGRRQIWDGLCAEGEGKAATASVAVLKVWRCKPHFATDVPGHEVGGEGSGGKPLKPRAAKMFEF